MWPRPGHAEVGSASATVVPSADFFKLVSGRSSLLSAAFDRYHPLCFPHVPSTSAAAGAGSSLVGLEFHVDDLDEAVPKISTDESYTLTLPDAHSAVANVTA